MAGSFKKRGRKPSGQQANEATGQKQSSWMDRPDTTRLSESRISVAQGGTTGEGSKAANPGPVPTWLDSRFCEQTPVCFYKQIAMKR
jgi:hypothetical protein